MTDEAPPLPAPPPAGEKPEGQEYPPPSAPVLTVSNALFTQRGYAYVEAFLRTLREQYDAGLQVLDFADEAAALAAINGWAEEATRGRITKVLERLDPATRLAIANAVYLKASWPVPFDDPRDGEFKVGGETVTVPTISKNETFGYATGSGWRSVTLPYFGDRLAMRLILPTGDRTPADLMTAKTLAAAATTKPTDVVLTMPTWDFGADLDLVAMLRKLGLTDVFDDGRADLSGITTAEQLFVDQALHKANITVDQLGTEAAAVTVLTAVATSGRAVPPVRFTVDRPFLFEIVDTKTGAPLFVGTGGRPAGEVGRYGSIHSSALVCSHTSRHMPASMSTLQPTTLRKMSPSRPVMPTAPAAIARFCGEIILPSTPPEEFDAAISAGSSPACLPGRHLQRAEQRVRRRVRAGDRDAEPAEDRREQRERRRPLSASQLPSAPVCPELFMTYASASTAITVTMAGHSCWYVFDVGLRRPPPA